MVNTNKGGLHLYAQLFKPKAFKGKFAQSFARRFNMPSPKLKSFQNQEIKKRVEKILHYTIDDPNGYRVSKRIYNKIYMPTTT